MEHLVFHFVPLVGTAEKTLAPSSLHCLFRYLYTYTSKHPLLQAEHLQLFQLLLTGECSISLIILVGLPECPGLSHIAGPRTGLHVWPHQCWEERKDNLSWPARDTLHKAARNTISLLSSKVTLLSHVQLGVHQDPQVLFCIAAF